MDFLVNISRFLIHSRNNHTKYRNFQPIRDLCTRRGLGETPLWKPGDLKTGF